MWQMNIINYAIVVQNDDCNDFIVYTKLKISKYLVGFG